MHSLQPSLRTILCNLGFRSVLPWDVPSESCRPGLVTCVLVQVKAALVPGRQQGRQQHVQQCLQQWRLRGKTASKGGCSTAAPGLVQNASAQAQPAAGCLQTGQLPCPRIWRRRRATKCNASCRAAFHPPSTRPPSHPPPAASPRAGGSAPSACPACSTSPAPASHSRDPAPAQPSGWQAAPVAGQGQEQGREARPRQLG